MVKIFSREPVRTGYLWIRDVEFMADGLKKPKAWTYVKNGQFVAGLIYNRTLNTFLFVSQYRIAVAENGDNPLFFEVVAGIHDQLTPEETMRKEMKEELGMNLPDALCEPIGRVYSSPGVTCEFGYLFYVEIETEKSPPPVAGAESENEYIVPVECTVDDAIAMLKRGAIIDSKTVLLLNWWLANKADWHTIEWSRSLNKTII